MKHILKTAALVGTFSLLSGMAVAEQHGEDMDPNGGVDSANDPTDVPHDREAHDEVDPDEPVLDQEGGVDSANDPDDTMIDPQGKVENGEVVPDSGVDSANDPDDTMNDPQGKVENGEEIVPDSGVDSANDPDD